MNNSLLNTFLNNIYSQLNDIYFSTQRYLFLNSTILAFFVEKFCPIIIYSTIFYSAIFISQLRYYPSTQILFLNSDIIPQLRYYPSTQILFLNSDIIS